MKIFKKETIISLKTSRENRPFLLVNNPPFSLKIDKKRVGYLLRPRAFTMFAFIKKTH